MNNPTTPSSPKSSISDSISGAPATAFAPSLSLPLRYFVFGLICFAIFGVCLPFFAEDVLAQYHYTHRTIAFTHLISLGWITSIIMGAGIQLVPVALGVPLHSERLARWTFWFHSVGVTGMIICFWLWNFPLMLWFGTSLTIGFTLFIYNMVRSIKKASVQDVVSIHMTTALVYLALTLLAGEYLMHDKVLSFSPFRVISGIHAHAHMAVLGWFTMMLMGISYRLVPMFTLSHIQDTRRIWSAYILLNIGILGIFTGILLDAAWRPWGAGLICVALGLWFWEMTILFLKRKRPQLDAALKHACVAMMHLPVLLVLGFWMSVPGELSSMKAQAQTSYALLALMGWISFFIMAMLYKIIPFLVWYKLYPPLVGRQPVPRIQDLYSPVVQRWAAGFFILGLWITAIFIALADQISVTFLRISSSVMGAGIFLFVINMSLPISRWAMAQYPAFFRPSKTAAPIKNILPNPQGQRSL